MSNSKPTFDRSRELYSSKIAVELTRMAEQVLAGSRSPERRLRAAMKARKLTPNELFKAAVKAATSLSIYSYVHGDLQRREPQGERELLGWIRREADKCCSHLEAANNASFDRELILGFIYKLRNLD